MAEKVQRSYRLDKDVLELVIRGAEEQGITQTEWLSRAIVGYACDTNSDTNSDTVGYACDTGSDTYSTLVEVLQEEVRALREQLTQAQAVNAVQARAIGEQSRALIEAPGRKRWWQFWRKD